MSATTKLLNGVISNVRVPVQHTIAGVKRSRIVKETLRLHRPESSDHLMETACALHNLRRAFRQPLNLAIPLTIKFLDYSR